MTAPDHDGPRYSYTPDLGKSLPVPLWFKLTVPTLAALALAGLAKLLGWLP